MWVSCEPIIIVLCPNFIYEIHDDACLKYLNVSSSNLDLSVNLKTRTVPSLEPTTTNFLSGDIATVLPLACY